MGCYYSNSRGRSGYVTLSSVQLLRFLEMTPIFRVLLRCVGWLLYPTFQFRYTLGSNLTLGVGVLLLHALVVVMLLYL